MLYKNQILNRKIIFVLPVILLLFFLEKPYLFLKNLKLALYIKHRSHQSDFFTVIQKQETTKTINNNFFAWQGKFERYYKQDWQHW